MFLNHSQLLDKVAGGWQISGTVVLSTGNPFTVHADQDTFALTGSKFPDWNPGVNWKPAHQTIQNWVQRWRIPSACGWNLW